jgi:hypothetical protein
MIDIDTLQLSVRFLFMTDWRFSVVFDLTT